MTLDYIFNSGLKVDIKRKGEVSWILHKDIKTTSVIIESLIADDWGMKTTNGQELWNEHDVQTYCIMPFQTEYILSCVEQNHNVIENAANGKSFSYCRDCKKEVL